MVIKINQMIYSILNINFFFSNIKKLNILSLIKVIFGNQIFHQNRETFIFSDPSYLFFISLFYLIINKFNANKIINIVIINKS